MKRKHQIGFIVIFLFMIYAVPVVQTSYEFRANQGHRIQILDLLEDIFVTPTQKATADAATIDSLTLAMQQIGEQVTRARAQPIDSAHPLDFQDAVQRCDEAALKVTMLKKSVIDYNRHLQGDHNKFAAKDTTRPYYASLAKFGTDLDSARAMLQSPQDLAALGRTIEQLKGEISATHQLFGNKKGVFAYTRLTLDALNRTMVGADYLRPYEKELESSSVFANAIRPKLLMAQYALFDDLGSKGIQGTHNWFFYKSDVDYLVKPYIFDTRSKIVDATDVPITEDIYGAIVSFKDQLAAKGIDLLLVIMPTKPSIYPDLLDPTMKPESAGTFSHSLRIMDELKRKGVETVDLFKPFAEARKDDAAAGDSLYLRTDTHFKNRAVRLTAKVVADRVKQFSWYAPGTTEYALDSLFVQRYGDIGEMSTLPAMTMRGLHFSFPAETTQCFQVYQVSRDPKGAVIDRTLYKDDYAHSRILVIGDSFSRMYQTDMPKSAGWISHLARELSQPVASVVSDGGASTMVREVLARKPQLLRNKKLVVWEVVERDFRYGTEGWKNVVIK